MVWVFASCLVIHQFITSCGSHAQSVLGSFVLVFHLRVPPSVPFFWIHQLRDASEFYVDLSCLDKNWSFWDVTAPVPPDTLWLKMVHMGKYFKYGRLCFHTVRLCWVLRRTVKLGELSVFSHFFLSMTIVTFLFCEPTTAPSRRFVRNKNHAWPSVHFQETPTKGVGVGHLVSVKKRKERKILYFLLPLHLCCPD